MAVADARDVSNPEVVLCLRRLVVALASDVLVGCSSRAFEVVEGVEEALDHVEVSVSAPVAEVGEGGAPGPPFMRRFFICWSKLPLSGVG